MPAILSETLSLIQGKNIVVGVSGGPDSLCLLHLLVTAGYRCVVAHCNHHLRPEADEDARAVDHLARGFGLPIEIGSAAVADHAREHGLSIEEAARNLRYQFLFDVARKHNAQAVAVGHSADDQAETVLMHFIRGAGLSGLKGMTVRSILPIFDKDIPIIRPLLSVTREETVAYCQEHNLPIRYDSSNDDQSYFRNRLRHALIPELQHYNPQIKQTLQRAALALQGDYDLLNELIASVWNETLIETNAKYISFDANKFESASIPLRRNLLKRAIEILSPGLRDAGFDVLSRAAESIHDHGEVDLVGGMYLLRESDKLFIATSDADIPFDTYPQIDRECKINETIDLGNDWMLTTSVRARHASPLQDHPFIATFDADLLGSSLIIRPAREGDRFQPFGMNGHSVKLSDLLVNLKIPHRARSRLPVLIAGDQIAWVIGIRIAHPFRVTDQTKNVIRFTLKR